MGSRDKTATSAKILVYPTHVDPTGNASSKATTSNVSVRLPKVVGFASWKKVMLARKTHAKTEDLARKVPMGLPSSVYADLGIEATNAKLLPIHADQTLASMEAFVLVPNLGINVVVPMVDTVDIVKSPLLVLVNYLT